MLKSKQMKVRKDTWKRFTDEGYKHYKVVCAGYKPGDFPNAERIAKRTISLPLSQKLGDKDFGDVIDAVDCILRHVRK